MGGGVESEFSDQLWLWPSRTTSNQKLCTYVAEWLAFVQPPIHIEIVSSLSA